MRTRRLQPSAEASAAAVRCYAHAGRWSHVVATLAQMRENGTAPVVGMYRALDEARRRGAGVPDEEDYDVGRASDGAAVTQLRQASHDEAMHFLFAQVPLALEVKYEDKDVLVVNKPAGCVVQPGRSWEYWSGTLTHAVLAHCCRPEAEGQPADWRPTVVHRLDKETSGVMVLAKTELAARSLREEFAERTVKRTYFALLSGCPLPAGGAGGRVETAIGPDPAPGARRMAALPLGDSTGKFAASRYKCLETFAGGVLSLVDFRLETGRTHQVRVHAAHLGCPLAGDVTYMCDKDVERADHAVEAGVSPNVVEALALLKQQGHLLHAGGLGFVHPRSGEAMAFEAGLPAHFMKVVGLLRPDSAALPRGHERKGRAAAPEGLL
jgi:23S rRNA pseudouridine1911/1915/1917 synthase